MVAKRPLSRSLSASKLDTPSRAPHPRHPNTQTRNKRKTCAREAPSRTLLPFDSQTPRPPRPLRPPRRPQCPDIQAKSSQDVRTLSSMSGHSRGVQGTPQCPDIVFGAPMSGHWNGTSSTSSCPDIVEGVCSMSGHLGQMSVFTSHCICSISASMSGHYEVDEVRSGRSGPFFYCNCRHQRGCRATSALRPR